MQGKAEKKIASLHLRYLPAFASYLLQQHIEEYSRVQIELSRQVEVPLLKYLDHLTVSELHKLAVETATEFLDHLARNQAYQFIHEGTKRWIANQLPKIDKHEVVAEDITLINYVRKQALLHFLPGYTSNAEQMIELIREIDYFTLQSETVSTNTYINILKEKIEENAYLLEKVNNTIPGAVYVFDLIQFKGVYSNNNLGNVIGHEQQELNQLGHEVFQKLIHPDDRAELQRNTDLVKHATDGEIRSYKYRIK